MVLRIAHHSKEVISEFNSMAIPLIQDAMNQEISD
jgi:hypothetical protein